MILNQIATLAFFLYEYNIMTCAPTRNDNFIHTVIKSLCNRTFNCNCVKYRKTVLMKYSIYVTGSLTCEPVEVCHHYYKRLQFENEGDITSIKKKNVSKKYMSSIISDQDRA